MPPAPTRAAEHAVSMRFGGCGAPEPATAGGGPARFGAQALALDEGSAPLSPGERACCCPAAAYVRVLVPPQGERRSVADLLLCAHHYRTSRRALTDIGAVAFDRDGQLMTTAGPVFLPSEARGNDTHRPAGTPRPARRSPTA